jgi:hypothetical protein
VKLQAVAAVQSIRQTKKRWPSGSENRPVRSVQTRTRTAQTLGARAASEHMPHGYRHSKGREYPMESSVVFVRSLQGRYQRRQPVARSKNSS